MHRVIALLMGALLAIGACQPNSTTPGPNPSEAAAASVAPTEVPSATPADVTKLFLAQIVGATKGQLTLTGSLELGSQIGDVGGSLTYVGGDSDQTTTITIAGVVTTTHNIHVAGVGYTQNGTGPWFKDLKPPATGGDLVSVLKALASLVDKGVETHDGVQAHRIELGAGTTISAAAFGLTDPAMQSPTVALVFYAADDGKPIAIVVTITWTQAVNGTPIPVKMTMDLAYTQIGGSLSVSVPDHVYQRFTSTRYHYALAYPDDWDADTSNKGFDAFNAPADDFMTANRTKVSGVKLNTFTTALISYEKSHFHWTFNSNVGITFGGVKARLLTFHYTSGGKKLVIYQVVALKGGYAYAVNWGSPAGHEADDLATFKQVLATFAFA